MSAANRKAPGPASAINNTITLDCRIPKEGFKALHHLLHAARTLHHLPALPDDALISADILIRRIRDDLARLGGAK